jgi:hypothetical protein
VGPAASEPARGALWAGRRWGGVAGGVRATSRAVTGTRYCAVTRYSDELRCNLHTRLRACVRHTQACVCKRVCNRRVRHKTSVGGARVQQVCAMSLRGRCVRLARARGAHPTHKPHTPATRARRSTHTRVCRAAVRARTDRADVRGVRDTARRGASRTVTRTCGACARAGGIAHTRRPRPPPSGPLSPASMPASTQAAARRAAASRRDSAPRQCAGRAPARQSDGCCGGAAAYGALAGYGALAESPPAVLRNPCFSEGSRLSATTGDGAPTAAAHARTDQPDLGDAPG